LVRLCEQGVLQRRAAAGPLHQERAMDRLFGKPKEKAPRPTLQDASETMEKRGERQDDRIMKLDKELARYTQQLKTMKPGPAKQQVQKRAMAILKQKKMYENQREQTRNQQFNMDQVMFTQESLAETANTVTAMKDANKALKKQFKAIDINQVEDMQDDMADLLEQAEEIQSAMGRSYNTDDIDEARSKLAE
jgi:charged multivesicular body protein 5